MDHRVLRAWERYGVGLRPSDILGMEEAVREGKGVRLRSNATGITYGIQWEGRVFIAVVAWSSSVERDVIVTFLPPDSFNKGRMAAHYKSEAFRRDKRRRKLMEREAAEG